MYHSAAWSSVIHAAAKRSIYLRLWRRIHSRFQGSLRLARAVCGVYLIALVAYVSCARAQDVTTWHYNNARTGVQSAETVLTPSNVNSAQFGKIFSLPVIGDVYAQPLYLHQFQMGDGQLHNVLIVATAQDYVYAFDADGKNPSQGYLWRQSLLGAGETWMSYTDANGDHDIQPNIGIIGTPVVDRGGGTVYVVAKSKTTSGTVVFRQRLHALNIADGAEKLNGPTLIQASIPGLGDGGTTITFNAHTENQRPALLLAPAPVGSGNAVFIAWASHGDFFVYHGWVIAYDASNIASQVGVWNDTPDGKQGGIWMGGGGLSSDDSGNIFGASGNGTFDANTGGKDYGSSAFRLSFGSSGLGLADYFTPPNEASLSGADNDVGTSALALLPTQGGSVPHLGVTVDKSGTIYLLNRDRMGGFTSPGDAARQNFGDGGLSIHNSVAFFNDMLYLGVDGGPVKAWAFNPSTELFSTSPQSQGGGAFGCNGCNGGGSTPSISANGSSNGIVWALDNSHYYNTPAILHAYNAGNLATELYNSTQAANSRDAGAVAIKFTTPTIANGHVYVGGRNAVTAYGMRSTGPLTATPTFSPAPGTYTATQSVTISDSTPNASIYYTTNGTTPSTGSTLYTGPIQVATSETIEAVALAPGFSQSADASATYTINTGSGCSAPGTAGVNVCTPANGSTVSSPVAVQAAANVTGTIARMEVWVNGVKDYSISGSTTLNTTLSLASGTNERFDFYAVNTAGTKWEQTVFASVGTGGGTCSAPSTPGVNVCRPVNGSTVGSPVAVQALSTVTGTIARMEVWVDGVKKFSTSNSTTLSTSLSLASGSHRFSFYAVNTAGTKWNTVVNATVQ